MRRRLFDLPAALLLLLCVASVALWVQSYWYSAAVWGTVGGRSYGVLSKRGVIEFGIFPADQSSGRGWGFDGGRIRYDGSWDADLRMRDNWWRHLRRSRRPWHWLGFTHAVGGGPGGGRADKLTAPHAAFAVAALLPLGARQSTRRISRRRTKSAVASRHCRCCGYDLRATPGRCPECGGVPAEAEP